MSDFYATCPRCRGDRYIEVCTDPGGNFSPSQWECFDCPLCRGTGECDRDEAEQWKKENEEIEEEE